MRVSGIKPSWWYWISVSRDYTTLPYLTISFAPTVGISDLSNFFRTYRTVNFCNWDRRLGISQWSILTSQLYQGWLMHIIISSSQFLNPGPFDRQLDIETTRPRSAHIFWLHKVSYTYEVFLSYTYDVFCY